MSSFPPSGGVAKVRVGRSGIHGRGVFATRRLRVAESVFAIQGPLVPSARVTQNGIQVWRDWYLEPRGVGRYVNHACRPNAEVTRGLVVRARRAVRPGEELTIDYATVMLWEPWRMPCRCGGSRCRGVVRAWGRTATAVRRRYPAPFFSFIERGKVPREAPPRLRAAARRVMRLRGPAANARSPPRPAPRRPGQGPR